VYELLMITVSIWWGTNTFFRWPNILETKAIETKYMLTKSMFCTDLTKRSFIQYYVSTMLAIVISKCQSIYINW